MKFNSYKELVTLNPENDEVQLQKYELLTELYSTSYNNETWLGLILDYLNDNDKENEYKEFYLVPDRIYGTRKHTYRFISIEEQMPCSISDDDIKFLKRLNARPKFILCDYEEKPSSAPFAYLENEKTLFDVIKIIGITEGLHNYLCEYCFDKLMQEKIKYKKTNESTITKTKKK